MWSKDFDNIYCENEDKLKEFIKENNIFSYNKQHEIWPCQIKKTIETGKYRPIHYLLGHYDDKYKEELMDNSIIDHAYFFKTKDNKVIYVSNSYLDYNDLLNYFNEDWQNKFDINVKVLKAEESWYNNCTCMIVFSARNQRMF